MPERPFPRVWQCYATPFPADASQMFGYVVPAWYGYAGWGCLDYYLEQPGRYTFSEAFFANPYALVHRLLHVAEGARDKRDKRDSAGLELRAS